jgi:hypothetical protein
LKSASNNPAENQLPTGVEEAALAAAVEKSGYPLQTIIAERLRTRVDHVAEEAAYVDGDSGDLRTIDIAASHALWKPPKQPRVRPELTMFIECKQSELPYVFFLANRKHRLMEFPMMCGLHKMTVTLKTDDDRSSWTFPVQTVLGADELRFTTDPEFSLTFSKAARKGKELALSGTEAFYGIVLPLVKTLQYFERTNAPDKDYVYYDLRIGLAVGVLDGPMVGARLDGGTIEYELVPWVRVIRHETYETTSPWDRDRVFAVDVVHQGFFDQYVDEHVLPFADDLGKRIRSKQGVLLSNKGFASGLGADSWSHIYDRLRSR